MRAFALQLCTMAGGPVPQGCRLGEVKRAEETEGLRAGTGVDLLLLLPCCPLLPSKTGESAGCKERDACVFWCAWACVLQRVCICACERCACVCVRVGRREKQE
jgi:hypothetical protein